MWRRQWKRAWLNLLSDAAGDDGVIYAAADDRRGFVVEVGGGSGHMGWLH